MDETIIKTYRTGATDVVRRQQKSGIVKEGTQYPPDTTRTCPVVYEASSPVK